MTSTSILTKRQTKTFGPRFIAGWGENAQIRAEAHYDDACGNGHNTFGITADIFIPGQRDSEAGGCLHDEIARIFPELAPFIKWHLVSTDGPMHYIANARYWAGFSGWTDGEPGSPPNLEYLKSTIVYGALPEDANFDLTKMDDSDLQAFLVNRLPALMAAFQKDMESLGFVY